MGPDPAHPRHRVSGGRSHRRPGGRLSTITESGEFGGCGYLDLQTGEVWDANATDPAMVGEDAAIDVEAEPDRWLRLEGGRGRSGWQDMADFAAHRADNELRARMERALEGRGSFRRFRGLVSDEGLVDQWVHFSTDRRLGRARDLLAAQGIRVGR